MPSNDTSLEEIKSRIDIVELISEYVSLKKSGHNWKGLCPFHSEKTPSFMVNPARQIYKCFGCGNGGDIFTFIMQNENLDFKEALRLLAKKAGVTLKISSEHAGRAGEKEILLKLQNYARSFFQQSLKKSSRAAGYLNKREISEKARQYFSIGYAPKSWDALRKHLEGKGFKQEMIMKAGLVSKGDKGFYDKFRDRIIFPIFNLQGEVIAFGGRVLDTGEPKYLNSPETPLFNKSRMLYGLNFAKKFIKETDSVLLMEGYLDVIVAHSYGFRNAVAPLGTAFTQDQGKLIKRFTDNAVLFFDRDEAGMKAAKNAIEVLLSSNLNVMMFSFPEGDDPDSFLKKNGKEAFNELLANPLSLVDFLLQQKKGKHLIIREVLEIISKADGLHQSEHITRLSDQLNINENHILEELKKIKLKGNRKFDRTTKSPDLVLSKKKSTPLDEMYIIKLVLQSPEKAGAVFDAITEDDFTDTGMRAILKKMRDGLTDFNKLTLKCDDEEKGLLSDIIFMTEFDDPDFAGSDKVIDDCISRVKEKKQTLLIEELKHKIKDAELKKDNILLKKLMIEQNKLARSRGHVT